MEFRDSPDEARFRHELRSWLGSSDLPEGGTDAAPHTWAPERVAALGALQRRMARDRWIAIRWPVEYGGRGATLAEVAIYYDELARAHVQKMPSYIGINVVGPLIIDLGTAEQRSRYLPPMLTGDEIWCQGFSEPNTGSDLASVRTRAEAVGDGFVVNGQKLWTTVGHLARRCLLLARTSEERHAGLTMLLVDMRTPGLEVRPIRQMTGESEFNEIFFTDVRVSRGDVLGEVGGGWRAAMLALAHERANLQISGQVVLEDTLRALHELARDRSLWDDSIVRDRIAGEAVHVAALRFLSYRVLMRLEQDGDGLSPSLLRLSWSQVRQRMTETATEILGLAHQLPGRWAYDYLFSRADTIAGGTSQVQRNILAERVLGLPREPRPASTGATVGS